MEDTATAIFAALAERCTGASRPEAFGGRPFAFRKQDSRVCFQRGYSLGSVEENGLVKGVEAGFRFGREKLFFRTGPFRRGDRTHRFHLRKEGE